MDDATLRSIDVQVYNLVDGGYPLGEILTKGRFLSDKRHDISNPAIHTHWHRKILGTYDPEKGTVLLSRKGSRNSLPNLEIP